MTSPAGGPKLPPPHSEPEKEPVMSPSNDGGSPSVGALGSPLEIAVFVSLRTVLISIFRVLAQATLSDPAFAVLVFTSWSCTNNSLR
jgi:hypothetical protein